MSEAKACITCGITKPISEFRSGKNGCKQCASERARAWVLATPEHLERKRAAVRRWREANRDRENQESRSRWAKRQQAVMDRDRESHRAWLEEHPEAVQTYRQNSKPSAATWRAANPAHARALHDRYQRDSLSTASRNYFEWAGWELELLSDQTRTSRSLAAMLGRTYGAVRLMRHKIRHDPQTIKRAGLSESGRV